MFLAVKIQMREILYPRAGFGHSGIGLAVLWPLGIAETSVGFEGVFWRKYLWWRVIPMSAFLAGDWDNNVSFGADASGFVLAPV